MTKLTGKQQWKPFLRIIFSNTPWLWLILVTAFSATYYSWFGALIPQYIGRIMSGDIQDTSIAWKYAGIMLAQMGCGAVAGLFSGWLTFRIDRNIKRSLWGKLMDLPMSEYDRITPTSLISRVTSDTTMISAAILSVASYVTTISYIMVVLGQIYDYDTTIAFSMILAIPYILLVMIIPGRFLHKVNAIRQEALSKFTTFVTERVMNMRLIKAASTEEKEQLLGYEAALENYKANLRAHITDAVIMPFSSSAQSVLIAVVLIMGSILVDQGKLGMDAIVTLYWYAQGLTYDLSNTVTQYHTIKQAQGASSKVSELMDTPVEILKREQSFTMPDADIVFDDVSFGYGEKEVLSHVSFTIPHGKTTAVVGPSGAGKTTVLSLLERLYTPSAGVIRFGDTPVEKINLDEWRRSMGYIQQDSPLMSGTIRKNIAYGMDREPSQAGVEDAAALANAAGFIAQLPDGYDTDIGQMGNKLSGGERQRVALARMMIRQPNYLLLDEATANLDAENAAAVQKALRQIASDGGRTSVIVAHDINTVRHADNIIVLDKGHVQAIGTHETLYNESKLYRRYCELLQMQDEPELA